MTVKDYVDKETFLANLEYELICESHISITLNKENIDNSRIIYIIKGDNAQVILKQDGLEDEVISKCKARKIDHKAKKKSWLKRLFSQ